MYEVTKFFHLAAGLTWLGGMTVLLCAVRPAVLAQLEGGPRVAMLNGILSRFFKLAGLCIAVLLASGGLMLAGVDLHIAPKGWHVMLGVGVLMCGLFGHLYFVPYRRLQRSVQQADWPQAAKPLAQIHLLVLTNFALGWVAVAAVVIWR